MTVVYAINPPNTPYSGGEELGWRLLPLPLEVRMAWESAGSGEEEAKPRPREIFLARKARGRGDPGARAGDMPRRGCARGARGLGTPAAEDGGGLGNRQRGERKGAP